jgi:hypothetical protein
MSTAEAIAATAAAALSQATSQQTSPTGSTVTHNADGTKTISGSVLGTDSTGASVTTATHVGDTTPPGIPTGITAWSGDGAVHVAWDGMLTGGIPADFCQVNLLVDGVAFAALNSAGSATYNGASAGTTVNVTATSEDDACAIDGTAAHNVSAACSAISVTVTDTAATTTQHFWADDSGAHISSTGDHDTSGFHQLMTSVKNAFMHGTTELMTISENLIELGKNSTSAVIKFCGELAQISAKKWTWFGTTRTGIDMHSTYGTSISADTSVSLDASVEATQLASDGSDGGAINLNGKWLDLYSTDMNEAYQASMEDVANALSAYFTVRRSADVITAYNSAVTHYTKIGTWSGTREAQILKIRVMTGDGFNGNATQNSWIDIFIKKSNTTSGTTNAFGVSYELHNASSAVLSPYVVATAYNSCDIWIKNSWGWESGWYIAEYNGGVWLGDGSWHQTSVPSGTLQSASCIAAIQPVVVLYNGGAALNYDTAPGAGTNGDITLSETAANFSNLKIFFQTNDNAYGSCEVPFPDGKRVGLSADWSTGAVIWYKARAIDIRGTSITTVDYGSVNSDGSYFLHVNVIYIVRVEGRR